jgi:hypothetical protein
MKIKNGLKELPTIEMVRNSAYFLSLKFKELTPFDCWIMAENDFKTINEITSTNHTFLNTKEPLV